MSLPRAKEAEYRRKHASDPSRLVLPIRDFECSSSQGDAKRNPAGSFKLMS